LARGRWVTISVRTETKKVLDRVCGSRTLDDCIAWLTSIHASIHGELKGNMEASFTVNGGPLCDTLVEHAAAFLRAHGYGLHAKLLEEMYSKRIVRLDLADALKDHKEIVPAHFVGFPPIAVFFDSLENDGKLYIEIKGWLKPCFTG
jgi:hypothetical protein